MTKYVKASMLTYDASIGRIEPGQTYMVDDEKAERWVFSGIATETPPPAPPKPDPQPAPPKPEEDDGEEEGEEEAPAEEDEEQRAKARELFEGGASQRSIAEALGISRQRVHQLLAA